MAGAEAEAFREAVERHGAAFGAPCGPAEREALFAYATLLMTWNARINLTGATSLADLAEEHLPDAFVLAARFSDPEPRTVIDVGSGGGPARAAPGGPASVLSPSGCSSPTAKKAAFLRTVVRELGMRERVKVETARAETVQPAAADVAISRATFPPAEWIVVGARLVRPGGHVFVLTTPDAEPPLAGAPLSLVERLAYLDGRRVLLDLVRPVA
jgi:16S rRNA (guanine527-N7)-methyltransferase